MASITSIKKIAEGYANKVWNDKNLIAIDEFVHHEIVIHSLLGDFYGSEALKNVVKAWLHGFPDLCVLNDCVTSKNDRVIIQWRATGTHSGEFKGRPPTGKKIAYSGVTAYRIQNNKIVEYWAYLDMQHLLSQI